MINDNLPRLYAEVRERSVDRLQFRFQFGDSRFRSSAGKSFHIDCGQVILQRLRILCEPPPKEFAETDIPELVVARNGSRIAATRRGELTRLVAVLTFVSGKAILSAQSPAPTASAPVFDVASVKRNTSGSFGWSSSPGPAGYSATNVALPTLVQFAYNVRAYQLMGGPDWIQANRFDIAARAGREVPNADLRLMVQVLLSDRFKLVVHREQRQMSHFTMLLARSDGRYGPNLQRVADDCDPARRSAAPERPPIAAGAAGFSGRCSAISSLARVVAEYVNAPVTAGTDLDGKWDYAVYFRSDRALTPETNERPVPASNLPSLFDALQEQLGLKLERTSGPVEVLVIDSVEMPTPN